MKYPQQYSSMHNIVICITTQLWHIHTTVLSTHYLLQSRFLRACLSSTSSSALACESLKVRLACVDSMTELWQDSLTRIQRSNKFSTNMCFTDCTSFVATPKNKVYEMKIFLGFNDISMLT